MQHCDFGVTMKEKLKRNEILISNVGLLKVNKKCFFYLFEYV